MYGYVRVNVTLDEFNTKWCVLMHDDDNAG